MEKLRDVLLPYKATIGGVASLVTIVQLFTGAFICIGIHDRKTTRGISAIPFVGAVAIGILVLKYGFLLEDDAMLVSNIAAISLNMCYTAIYLYYSENAWEEVYKYATLGVLTVGVVLGYAEMEDPNKLVDRYGLLLTILQLLLLGSPLTDLANIISSKDASSIPYPIVFMAAIVTFLWFIYAIILNNIFMIIQNIIGFILCIIQLGLVYMYGYNIK